MNSVRIKSFFKSVSYVIFVWLQMIGIKTKNFFRDYFNPSVLKLSFYDFSKLYKGSVLGVFWTFFKPVFSTAIFYLGNIIINPAYATNMTSSGFPLWMSLIIGMLVWSYLGDSLNTNSNILNQYSFLITKMRYKKNKIYLFSNISKFFQHLVLMSIFFIIYLIIYFTLYYNPQNVQQLQYLVQLPIVAILMVLFFTCWTSFVAPMVVISSDLQQIIALFVTSVFWISGTFFDTSSLIEGSPGTNLNQFDVVIYNFICLNPLATFISLFKTSYVGNPNNISFTDGTNYSDYNWFFSGHWNGDVFLGYWYKVIIILAWCVVFILLAFILNRKTKGWLNDLL